MNTDAAKRYNRIKLSVALLHIFLDVAFWTVIIFYGFHRALAAPASQFTGGEFSQFLVFAAMLGLLKMVISLPLSFYAGYRLEHRFELSNQNIWQWAWEQLKGLLLGVILGGILLSALYWILLKYPQNWWLAVWLFLIIFSLLLTRLAPTLLFPLFYKFERIDRDDLKNSIDRLAAKFGLRIEGVFRFNLSKTTKKANAAFTGLGKSKRVILGDTLLNNFEPEEIEAVFAHEIGHFHKKHLLKGIAANSLLMLLGLYLVSLVYGAICNELGCLPHQLEALPWLALLFLLYGQITAPLGNYLSRKFEYEADAFAAKNIADAGAFISALQKLSVLNLADETPHPLVEFLFYSHPSVNKRITALSGAP